MDETNEVKPLPVAAQNNIKEIRAQMISLQTQLQQFVDGILIGMGLDISVPGGIKVDLDSMTVTIPKEES